MFAVVRTLLLGGIAGKVLGVVRELVAASLFGTGPVAAAFRLAQSAFLIPLQGFATEALNAGFTPRFGLHRRNDLQRAEVLFASMHLVLVAAAIAVAVLLFALADLWVRLLAPGLDEPTRLLAVRMVQILSFALPPYLATALYAAADLSDGRGQLMASRTSVQSIGLLAGTVMAWLTGQPLLIAVGFVLAHVVLLAGGIALMRRMRMPMWPGRTQRAAAWSALQEVWRTFRVLLLVPVVMQLHFIAERRVASTVDPGALAALDYARFVSDTAVVLLAVPFGLAGLGSMAGMDERQFRSSAIRSLRILLYVGVPMSAILVAHAKTIVELLFARGAFGAESIAITSTILVGAGAGLWAQLVGYCGAKFLSARGQNRSVLGLMTGAVAINIALNLLAVEWLGPAVLGIASAANAVAFAGLVAWRLKVVRELAPDLASLLPAALLYCLAWRGMPSGWGGAWWCIAAGALAFWGAALISLPRHRVVVLDAWRSLSASRSGKGNT